MRTVVVTYQTKPEHADENTRLIGEVFAELQARNPQHFGYAAFALDDGVSFVHISREYGSGDESLADLPAFKAFLENGDARRATEPVAKGATLIGAHNLLVRE